MISSLKYKKTSTRSPVNRQTSIPVVFEKKIGFKYAMNAEANSFGGKCLKAQAPVLRDDLNEVQYEAVRLSQPLVIIEK